MQRNIDINVFQVVYLCATHLDVLWQHLPLSDLTGHNNYLFSVHSLVDISDIFIINGGLLDSTHDSVIAELFF